MSVSDMKVRRAISVLGTGQLYVVWYQLCLAVVWYGTLILPGEAFSLEATSQGTQNSRCVCEYGWVWVCACEYILIVYCTYVHMNVCAHTCTMAHIRTYGACVLDCCVCWC